MVLQTQTVPFVFSAGLNSGVDSFQLPSPQLLQADNVRFQLDGAISKRTGFDNLPQTVIGGGFLNSGVACQVFNGELLAFDGTFIYSFINSLQAWSNRGLAISVINDQTKIVNTRVAQQNNPDGTNLNNQEVFIWEDTRNGGEIRYAVIDTSTDAFIVSDTLLNLGGAKPKVIAVPNTNSFNMYYTDTFNSIVLETLQTIRPGLPPVYSQIITDGAGTTSYLSYDVCIWQGAPLVIYGAVDGLRAFYNGAETLLVAGVAGITCITVTCAANNFNLFIAYSTPEGVFCILTTSIDVSATVTSVTTMAACNLAAIESIIPEIFNLSYEISGATNSNSVINVTVLENNNIVGNWSQLGVGLASKPFKINNQVFVNVIWQSMNQSTYFTLCASQGGKAISKILPGVGGTYRTNGMLAQCDLLTGTSTFGFANQQKGAFTTNNNTSYSLLGVNASYLDFTNVDSYNSIAAANNLHIVGGIEKIYDRVSVVEDNFNLYPEVVDGTGCSITLTTGGHLTYVANGTYQYIICYEWTDNANQVERGQPSLPTIVQPTAANQAAVLTIPTLLITDKIDPRSPVSIAVFRTILIAGVPSDVFYKVTSDLTPIINRQDVTSIQFTDTTSDIQIASNEPLYTASQLFNSAPPACSLVSNYLTRVFLSGMEDPNIIWTSQDRFDLSNYNTIPIEFSPELTEGVDSTGGPITAIHSLDQAMIIFKENTIFYMNGSGPNANGTSGGFSDAIPIPADAGCTNPNSIISIPGNQFNSGGLMYQSSKGIYLIDRSYINTYIGKPMEQYNSYHITSAELLDYSNEVVFLTLEGTALVYNYYFNRWSTWSYLPAVDSCIWNNQLVLIQSNGVVLVQQNDWYADYDPTYPNNEKPVVRNLQIPWIAFAGIQGFQSVFYCQLIGHYISPHILNMSVCYNYNPAPQEPISINANQVSNTFGSLPTFGASPGFGGGPFTLYQWQYNFGYPWGQSISLMISDSPLDNTNQGVIWSGLNFEIGVFQDAVRLPARQKFSGVKTPGNQ